MQALREATFHRDAGGTHKVRTARGARTLSESVRCLTSIALSLLRGSLSSYTPTPTRRQRVIRGLGRALASAQVSGVQPRPPYLPSELPDCLQS